MDCAYCTEKPSVATQDTELGRALTILSPFAAILLDTVNRHCLDWFNKETDWSIAEQDRGRWESLTQEEKGWSQESPADAEEAKDEHSFLIKVLPPWQSFNKEYGLT